MVALLLVKEDMGFFMAGIGLCLILTRAIGIPRKRLIGLAMIVVGIAYSVAAIYAFIPAMGGRASYYWAYQSLGPNAPAAARHIVTDPVYAAGQLFTPRLKLHTELELFAPFLFLSLLSPYTLPAIPLIFERFLASKFPNWWTNTFHYNAYLVVPIALGAVDGAVRLDKGVTWFWRSTTRPGTKARERGDRAVGAIAPLMAVLFLVTAIVLLPFFGWWQMTKPSFYHRNAEATAEAHAASLVPSGAVVTTTGNSGPFLLARDTVEVWDCYGYTPRTPPWIIANDQKQQFGFFHASAQQAEIARLKQLGYVVVWYDKPTGYMVLHATRSFPATIPKPNPAAC
jgi:uncharacterized membrane protein